MWPRHTAATVCICVVLVGGGAAAQRGGRGEAGFNRPGPDSFNGAFTFCRLAPRMAFDGDGGSWAVDYPRADRNLPTRLAEQTKAPVPWMRRAPRTTSSSWPRNPRSFSAPS